MSIETRPFPINYWTQIKTRKLSPSARAVGAFFWANKFTSVSGVYFVDPSWIASCTGYDESTIDLHIEDLIRHSHVEYDEETCEVLIIDWFRYHKFTGHWKNVLKAEIDKIESVRLKRLAHDLAIKSGHIQSEEPTKSPEKEDVEENQQHNSPTQQQPNSTPTSIQQQPAAEDVAVGSGGQFIFHKVIDQTLHQQLADLLQNVGPALAQQMLDSLASNILYGQQNPDFNVRYPLKLIDHFINVSFDPSAGLTISKNRDRVAAEEGKRKLEEAEKKKPFKNISAGKTSAAEYLKSKKYLDKGIDMGQNVP